MVFNYPIPGCSSTILTPEGDADFSKNSRIQELQRGKIFQGYLLTFQGILTGNTTVNFPLKDRIVV